MNKTDLVAQVARDAGISAAAAARAVDSVTGSIIKAVGKGEAVTLVGFGTFGATQRAARSGRNPKTGDTIQIQARKSPSFKAGKTFKDAVNK